MNRPVYKAQVWDTDMECWTDFEEVQPHVDRSIVELDLNHEKRRCAYKLRTRIVKDGEE
jgi:hypothetical protein